MYKIVNGMFPFIIQNIFVTNVDIHVYSTKHQHNLHIFPCRSTLSLFVIKYQGPKLWDQLPVTFRQIKSFPLFKRKVKDYL